MSLRGRLSDNELNFSAGPGALPESVLRQAQDAILEVPGQGLSVLGLSHRTPWFRDVVDEAEENIRQLLHLPAGFRVLFLQGGSSLQFGMIPQSLLRSPHDSADYLVTGYWSRRSIEDVAHFGQARVVWSGESQGYRRVPSAAELECDPRAVYLHYVSNETVEGVQFHEMPGRDDVPRICDMSSDFLSAPIDCDHYSLIYAHAQKNLGPAGVTVVLLDDSLLERCRDDVPAMLNFHRHAAAGSIYNTPPVFAIYVLLLVTRWLRDEVGGLEAMQRCNQQKADCLSRVLDAHPGFWRVHAEPGSRSVMNIAFRLPTPELERRFLEQALDEGLRGLEGHRSVGGLRVSLYNGVTLAAVECLAEFLRDFQARQDHPG
jgi:phosphoserine aminotransferase